MVHTSLAYITHAEVIAIQKDYILNIEIREEKKKSPTADKTLAAWPRIAKAKLLTRQVLLIYVHSLSSGLLPLVELGTRCTQRPDRRWLEWST